MFKPISRFSEFHSTALWCLLLFAQRLKAAGYKVQFCTNEDTCTREQLVSKLGRFGFKLSPNEILAPPPVARKILQERNLRPLLLLHPGGLAEFEGMDCHHPNCVVIGGAEEQFTYEHMNEAFRLLLNSENPVLLAMGYGWVVLSWSMFFVWLVSTCCVLVEDTSWGSWEASE